MIYNLIVQTNLPLHTKVKRERDRLPAAAALIKPNKLE